MSSDEQMNAVLRAWREGVRGKERRVFRLEERIELRMNAIERCMYTIRIQLDDWEIRRFHYRMPGDIDFIDPDWQPFKLGDRWGGEGISAYFRKSIAVPKEFDGKPITVRMFLGGDSLVSINGVPHHGMDIFRNEFLLTPSAKAGEVFNIDIESYVYWHGHGGEPDTHPFEVCEMVHVDPDIHGAYWDFRAAAKLFSLNDLDVSMRAFLESTVWKALKEVPVDEPDMSVFKSKLKSAQEQLRANFYASERFKDEGLMHMVGHSHLDLVFLWTYGEYIRKVGRTHATMLRLMEQYPEFKFAQSQAKIYADMKEHYPALFEQVKERVREGRWEPLGAFWVEPDCNLVSGESFVRQIMQGQQFWQKEFGMTSRICWQPDVFGVSWALPQIMKRSGVDYFMTNKMFVWNDTNRWTKSTFWWEGPDGSRVLCAVPPGHFIGTVDPDQMADQWDSFTDKVTIGESLYCYGWGDGGGGVDPEMLECARRYPHAPGLVKTVMTTALEAFESIERKAKENQMPVVNDELYLEAHRGTFTSRGRLKKINRQGEFLLRETEMVSALAWMDGFAYPQEKLTEVWQEFLTNQFHDALPGTHIPQVYIDLLASYDSIFGQLGELRNAATREILGTGGAAQSLVAFNSFLHTRHDLLSIPFEQIGSRSLLDQSGRRLVSQEVTALDGTKFVLAENPGVPPVGSCSLSLDDQPESATESGVKVGNNQLENEYLRARFSKNGELISLWDKESGREVIAEGSRANVFQMYQDTPGRYDAWDIVASYMEHEIELGEEGSLTIDEEGPLRASLLLERPLRRSKLTQRISLEAGSRCLKFETKIDWVERQTLLKVAFPVEIRTREATYDMPYGNITRPTHRNTSFDEARFEVPAHKWMDISEEGYGVSVINDCKYGHEVNANVMRLTLLKGPIFPDAQSDVEDHFFTYCLYPHQGDWKDAGTEQVALDLNQPCMISATDKPTEPARSWMSASSDHVTLEALKCSEDGENVIVRLAERYGSREPVELVFDRPIKEAWKCNLMETPEQEIAVQGSKVSLGIKPFEVVTIRLQPE